MSRFFLEEIDHRFLLSRVVLGIGTSVKAAAISKSWQSPRLPCLAEIASSGNDPFIFGELYRAMYFVPTQSRVPQC
jgi:hypothetical protein